MEGSREVTVVTVEVGIVEGSAMGIAVGTADILESLAEWW